MTLTRSELEKLLPHRPPILMLDRVVDIVPRKRGTGLKCFSKDDPCFAGHFPGFPILPGALAIEAMAQTAAAVFLAQQDPGSSGLGMLGKVNEMTFFARIVPEDEARFVIEVERAVGPFFIVNAKACVDDRTCAAGKLTLKMGAEGPV